MNFIPFLSIIAVILLALLYIHIKGRIAEERHIQETIKRAQRRARVRKADIDRDREFYTEQDTGHVSNGIWTFDEVK